MVGYCKPGKPGLLLTHPGGEISLGFALGGFSAGCRMRGPECWGAACLAPGHLGPIVLEPRASEGFLLE